MCGGLEVLCFTTRLGFGREFLPALASVAVVAVKEWLGGRYRVKLERLRMHEASLLTAYKTLYRFISRARASLFPPSEPRRDFLDLMRSDYFKFVKPQMLLFPPDIRDILAEFEGQYECLGDPDLRPREPFDEFIDRHAWKHLRTLTKAIEIRTEELFMPPDKKADRSQYHQVHDISQTIVDQAIQFQNPAADSACGSSIATRPRGT